jgi:hypothetical protein
MKSTLRLGAAILLALPLLAACDASTPEPTASPSAEVTPAASPTEPASPSPEAEPACTEVAPDANTVENLQAVVNIANTEPLLGWVTPTVNVVLAASEAYGPQTPDQAAIDLADFLIMDYSTLPAQYDFALPAATLDAYRAGDYAEYFPPTALVGRGSDNRVVAFSFDCDGLIDTMLLVGDESLLF